MQCETCFIHEIKHVATYGRLFVGKRAQDESPLFAAWPKLVACLFSLLPSLDMMNCFFKHINRNPSLKVFFILKNIYYSLN